jgi:hypothetical protein
MIVYKIKVLPISIAVVLAIILYGLSRMLSNPHLMTLILGAPSIDSVWAADKRGQEVSVKLDVPREIYFSIGVKMYVDASNPESRERVRKIAGNMYYDREGVIHDTGVSFPVQVVIKKLDHRNSEIILDKMYDRQILQGSNSVFYTREILAIPLSEGRYIISATSLEDTVALKGIDAHFYVSSPGNLK